MSLKFYTDTHIDRQVTIQLRARGVNIVRCQEVGLADVDDETHLTYASEQGRILITFDQGFRDRAFTWLAEGKSHAGVIMCKPGLQSEAGIGVIVKRCAFYHEAVEAGAATIDEFQNQFIEFG